MVWVKLVAIQKDIYIYIKPDREREYVHIASGLIGAFDVVTLEESCCALGYDIAYAHRTGHIRKSSSSIAGL